MVTIALKSFGGISPRISPRVLSDNLAQTATNCDVFSSTLRPLPDVSASVVTLPKVGAIKTMYRFGQDISSDTQYWFHWLTDVDVCRSQIAGDTSEWTFYTGDGAPKATYAALALTGGTDYPVAWRTLGIPAPSSAVTATVSETSTTGAIPETRVYTYTWVSKEAGFEMESAPAPPSGSTDSYLDTSVTLTAFSTIPSGTYNITHVRIYRATAGTYLYVDEIPVSQVIYEDTVSADALGNELPSLTWDMPPSGLKGLINLPNGLMAGFTGRDVYFCEPYHPYAWPTKYNQTVDYPIVGFGRTDTTLVVLTSGAPYFIQGTHPENMAVVKSELEQACVAKQSIVSVNGMVLYASPDGLVQISPGNTKLITESMFRRDQWQAMFKPESIRAYQHDLKYVAFYDNGTTQGGFIYDLSTGQFAMHTIYALAGYNDLQRDQLFLTFTDKSVKKWYAGAGKTLTWKSKKFSMPQITGFSVAQVESEGYPITFKLYSEGALIYTKSVTSRTPFRLPPGRGYDWEFEVSGAHEIFNVVIAQSMQEVASA